MNVAMYDETARGVHAPMYAYYAGQIKVKTGKTAGICLDVGCGGGYLGLALAKITDLAFIFMDLNPEMLLRADAHIREDGFSERAHTVQGDVHHIPLEDGAVDLVISRGSIPFWKYPGKALKEIHRVLAPEGEAYVGGGRGTPELMRQIEANMEKEGKSLPRAWKDEKGPSPGRRQGMRPRNYDSILERAGIPRFSTSTGEDGRWIRMWK